MATTKRPFSKRQISTLFLRVPTHDWPLIITGQRGEFRAAAGNVPQLFNVNVPTLAVCYRKRKATGDYDWRLMVLEAFRQERLAAISDEGLRLAGYDGPRDRAFTRFRRDWVIREKRKFTPSRTVMVMTVRRLAEGDLETLSQALLRRLYGEFLDAA